MEPLQAARDYHRRTLGIGFRSDGSRRPRHPFLAVLLAAGLGLAACGGDGGEETGPTSVSSTPDSPTSSAEPATTARPPRERPPGPPGPTIPNDLNDAVHRWFDLLAGGRCQTLLSDVQTTLPGLLEQSEDNSRAYGTLYRGAARACLGQLDAARRDLEEARALLAGLDPTNRGTDTTCQPQRLLSWAFRTYLGRQVPADCPVTTTSRGSTTTTLTRPPGTSTTTSTS